MCVGYAYLYIGEKGHVSCDLDRAFDAALGGLRRGHRSRAKLRPCNTKLRAHQARRICVDQAGRIGGDFHQTGGERIGRGQRVTRG